MNAFKEIIVEGLSFYIESFLKHLKVERGCADFTIEARKVSLNFFQRWAYSKELFSVTKITKDNLHSFEKYLFNYKKTNSEGLTFLTQRSRISAVRSFFSWLFKENHILYNPSLELEYPKKEKTLPRFILTENEAKKILRQPDTSSIYGIRDRAILEIFYSCGLRRGELLNLCVYDIDFSRQTLSIRKGKGQKDRIIPLGDRALYWLEEYLNKARPIIKGQKETESLFLIKGGEPMKYQQPGIMVRHYMEKSGIEKKAGCHIFRHTMATHMLGKRSRYSLRATDAWSQPACDNADLYKSCHW